MDNAKPKITIFDSAMNTVEVREMTDEEIAALPKDDRTSEIPEEEP